MTNRAWKAAICLAAFAVATIFGTPCAARKAAQDPSREREIGSDAASDLERTVKLVAEPAVQQRVNDIGQKLAKVARTTPVSATYGSADPADFEYRFKVIKDKEINAFALPGGFVYVNKGLVDYVKSDDELAGVLAHEIAHVSHHHGMKLLARQSKIDGYIALIAIVGILTDMPARDFANVLYGVNLVKTSKMGGYCQEAEIDADRTAVTYLVKSGYPPSQSMVFLKRLSQDVQANPQLPLGIFQTHPPYRDRARVVIAAMDEQGIQYDAALAPSATTAIVKSVGVDGRQVSQVTMAERVFFQPADTATLSSAERAAAIAQTLNSALKSPRTHSRPRITCDSVSIEIDGSSVLSVASEDLTLNNTTTDKLILQAVQTIQFAVWSDWVSSSNEL